MEKELVNLLQAGYDLYRLQSGFGPISPEIDKAVANFDNRLNQLADMPISISKKSKIGPKTFRPLKLGFGTR